MTTRTIIALDPGLASGCAVLRLDEDRSLTLLESHELPVEETWAWLGQSLGNYSGDLLDVGVQQAGVELVAETFIITTETAKKSQSPWSLRLLGVAEYLAHAYAVPFIEQTPSQAKRLVTNDMLRAGGVWHKGGEGHANDAIRHAVYRLLTSGWSGEGVVPV